MLDFLKNNVFGLLALVIVAVSAFSVQSNVELFDEVTTITNPWTFQEEITLSTADFTSTGGDTTLATTTVENFTTGGQSCTLTDANGGAYVLTQAQLLQCGIFTFAAGGAGQAVIALTMPATSTMTTVIPNAGDCKEFMYDASNLAAATTTTMTTGTGHHIIAYTTADDVIDGNEFALIKMCRAADTDVNTFTTELLHAD